jgi:hypothetical protein
VQNEFHKALEWNAMHMQNSSIIAGFIRPNRTFVERDTCPSLESIKITGDEIEGIAKNG